MRSVSILAVICLLSSSATHAADSAGRFSVRGAGLLTCEVYLEERASRSDLYYLIGGWLDGYITGRNQYQSETYDVTTFESSELLLLIVENHCKSNPGDGLFAVVNSLLGKIHANRLKEGAASVTVEVGGRKTSLYVPTIARIQKALIDRGLLSGPPSGEFDEPTRVALAAFQSSVGYAPTGFPDQATLWKLLSGGG